MDGSSSESFITLQRDVALADGNVIGDIEFESRDGGAALVNYAAIRGVMESDVVAAEEGSLQFFVTEAGTHDVLYMALNDASSGRIECNKDIDFVSSGQIIWGNLYRRIANTGLGFIFEVETGDNYTFAVNSANEMILTATELDLFNKYIEIESISSPGVSGSVSIGRIFMDSGNNNELSTLLNGSVISLEAGGASTFTDVIPFVVEVPPGPSVISRYTPVSNSRLKNLRICFTNCNRFNYQFQIYMSRRFGWNSSIKN